MPLTKSGEIAAVKGKRGVWELRHPRDYTKKTITKPIRERKRAAAIGEDPNEQRAADVQGSLLERIVFKRLTLLVGPPNIGFIYKFQLGAVEGVDARAFIGGFEMDFIILARPSFKELALEVQGAHWHGPKEQYADQERAIAIIGTGRDYAEIWEYEIMMGDEYLDTRLTELIGIPFARVPRGRLQEIRDFDAEFDREVPVKQT